MEVVADQSKLPHQRFAAAWDSIKIAQAVRDRLTAQALLAFTVRQKLSFVIAPLHGLIVLSGPPAMVRPPWRAALQTKSQGR